MFFKVLMHLILTKLLCMLTSDGDLVGVQMAAMCDISATETAIIYGLEPVWGAAFAWFLLGERWSTAGWVGAVLVLGKVMPVLDPFDV